MLILKSQFITLSVLAISCGVCVTAVIWSLSSPMDSNPQESSKSLHTKKENGVSPNHGLRSMRESEKILLHERGLQEPIADQSEKTAQPAGILMGHKDPVAGSKSLREIQVQASSTPFVSALPVEFESKWSPTFQPIARPESLNLTSPDAMEIALEIKTPRNAPVPAVVAAVLEVAAIESGEINHSPPPTKSLNQVLEDYVTAAEHSRGLGDELQVARQAANSSDEHFRALYGADAYLKYTREAARLTLQETP